MADFQISSNSGRQWASGTIKQVNGQRGLGFYRLTFILMLNIDTSDAVLGDRLTDLVGDVFAANTPLGRAHPMPNQLPVQPYNFVQEKQVNLELELDRARLEALEHVRGGKDLAFNLNLYTTLTDSNGNVRQVNVGGAHVLNQSAWIALLEQIGYQKTMLLEVPVSDAQQQPELAAGVRSLASAQQAMARGDYREAVGLCRDVLEQVSLALKDNDSITFVDARDMNKADRLRLLRRAARVFTHPARHQDKVTTLFDWNRVDAASTISMVAALLNELEAPGARDPSSLPKPPPKTNPP